ncbi:MAG: response regulator [Gammaproteobacteria bacterium]|nr:response regulator [Gammaproteobacteria bacterium]
MSLKPHVLVCDDETDVREMVAKYLAKREFDVTMAFDGPSLDEQMNTAAKFDLVLLDINMPGEDGLSILRRIRAEQPLPVIMLTAAGEPVDKVIGLEMGADDYLAKPIDLRELEARIKAVLRRTGKSELVDAESIDNADKVSIADMVLDLSGATLYGRDGKEIPLTSMEYTLLKLFIKNKGRVLNRDQLMEMASDRDWDPFDRSIDIRVLRLRKKLEANPKKPTIIRTVRGLGYVFDPKDG